LPLHVLLALAATAATPAAAPNSAKPEPVVSVAAKGKSSLADRQQAMAMMGKMFDTFFPAGPDPDPVRLAAAREATMTMFPKGAYAAAMTSFLERSADRVLDMSEAELAAMMPADKVKKNKDKPLSTEPLRLTLAKKDPAFDAKVAAIKAFAGTMIVKFGDVAEPKFREGMSRALARKFDAAQMAEIRTFLATPTGAAYGREMVGLWFEPDVMRGTFQMLPDMMKLMPGMAKDAAAFDAQMKAAGKAGSPKKAD